LAAIAGEMLFLAGRNIPGVAYVPTSAKQTRRRLIVEFRDESNNTH